MAENVEKQIEQMDLSGKSEKGAQKGGKKGKKAAAAGSDNADRLKELIPPPEFLAERQILWDKLKQEADEKIAAMPSVPIKVTLPDGKEVEGQSWRTTPYEVAKSISQGLADNCVVAKVNGVVWDLDRPFEGDATLQLLKFEDEEGQYVFWHSSAHILGEAMERLYGGHLCYGPPIEGGFYYDMWSESRTVSSEDYPVMEGMVKGIVKEKQPFERLEMTKEDLLKMFAYNKFKQRILTERVTTPTTTVYKMSVLEDIAYEKLQSNLY